MEERTKVITVTIQCWVNILTAQHSFSMFIYIVSIKIHTTFVGLVGHLQVWT
jgi:hypothetical protein